ncbi:MAG: hypothetical protein J7K88_10830 [Candidatus Fermentibacteraceae bacterium]|nr:hypothetical protein [Candidatus Fermentibacteraceae bacterium]
MGKGSSKKKRQIRNYEIRRKTGDECEFNYYGISEYYRPIPGLDEWLRRRIRMCYWKQWRYTRTKVSNLLKLGTYKKEAIMTALSRKGLWHLSRTRATQAGMTNKWLKKQGLISIKDQWVNIHYPATAR